MMEMNEKKFRKILQKGLSEEADKIMEKVNRDPDMGEVVAPEGMLDKLHRQIREYEEARPDEEGDLSEEEQELIRLGKRYKKNRCKRKLYLFAAAIVCVLAFGTTTLGDGKKVIQKVKGMVSGKEQTITKKTDEDIYELNRADESSACDEIEEKLGFYPVQMEYMPEGMKLVDVVVEEALQTARMRYVDDSDKSIFCCMVTNHRNGSVGDDIEDELIQQYEKQVAELNIKYKQFFVEDGEEEKWSVEFVHENVQYSITFIGLGQKEVEKTVQNLCYS